MSEAVQQLIDSMLSRAHREPLGVDVSDYSDEWCAGFLRGQTSALEELSFALTTEAALQRPTPKLPLFDSGNPNLSAEADAHFGPGCPPPESSRAE